MYSSPGTWLGGGQIGDKSKRLSNKWQKCVSSGLSMCRGKGTTKDDLVFNGRRKRLERTEIGFNACVDSLH